MHFIDFRQLLTFGRCLFNRHAPSSIFFVLVVIAAVATSDDHNIESDGYKSANEQYTLVDGFAYPKQPNLPYPTCKLKKGLEIDGLSDALQLAASDNSLSDAGELLLAPRCDQFYCQGYIIRIVCLQQLYFFLFYDCSLLCNPSLCKTGRCTVSPQSMAWARRGCHRRYCDG